LDQLLEQVDRNSVPIINLELLYYVRGTEIEELDQWSASAKTRKVHVKALIISYISFFMEMKSE